MAFFIFHLNLCGTLATRIRGILIKNGDIINITVRCFFLITVHYAVMFLLMYG